MKIERYLSVIKKINTLEDSKFEYKSSKWKNLNPEYKIYIKDFENKDISRNDVIYSFQEFYDRKITWQKPFLLTMVWGFADTGYGTYRTNNYINSEVNHNLIEKALEYISNEQFELSYKTFKMIKGLNISYISKIMYFATRACGYKNYFLIYDIRVAKSLIMLTSLPEIAEIVVVNPSSKFKHYNLYNKLIHRVSRENNIDSEALEMFLFEQKF